MTLRIMLIGLVASLGYEPSSDPDFSRWAQAGAEMVRAWALDHSGPTVAAKPDLIAPIDCHQVAADVEESTCCRKLDEGFDKACTVMVADLIADLDDAGPLDEAEEVLTFAPPVSTGLPEGEEVACMDFATVETPRVEVEAVVEAEDVEAEAIDAEVEANEPDAILEPECRLDDLATAVRLTRDAIQAWTSVIQDHADASLLPWE